MRRGSPRTARSWTCSRRPARTSARRRRAGVHAEGWRRRAAILPSTERKTKTLEKLGRPASLIALIIAAFVWTLPAEGQQPQSCVPSKFGPNDEIGNLNYVTPEKTLAAVKLVTKGKAYRL